MNKEAIKELALANGFKLKEQLGGAMDLNPYVYEFAAALESVATAELKAQVELLRVAATVVLSARDEDGITTSGLLAKFDELSKALSFLPAHCLAEIKAQAVIDAIDAHKNNLLTFDFNTAIRVTDLIKYANQLRWRLDNARV